MAVQVRPDMQPSRQVGVAWGRLGPLPPVLASWAAYLAAAPLLATAGGIIALGSTALIPALVTAWVGGMRLGFGAGLTGVGMCLALASMLLPGSLALENAAGYLVGAAVVVTAAAAVGRMRDLSVSLGEAEVRYRSLIDGMPAIIYIGRPGGLGVEYISPQVEALTGYPAPLWQEASNTLWEGCLHPDDRELAAAGYRHTMATGEPFDCEYRLRTRDDRVVWVHDRARVLTDSCGKPTLVQGVILDITAQKEGELASEQNEAKSRFLANMSHELRTPLNAILGFGQLLADPGFGVLNPRQRRYVGNIDRAGKHLLDLVNEVLDLAKVHSGQLEIAIDEVALEPLLSEAIGAIRPQAAASGLALSIACDPGLTLRADRLRLLQVLLNLLSNAVKFTSKGYISVVATTAGEMVRIAVSDSGPGIGPEDQERIFEEFTQINSGKTRTAEGTGLGLALSRRMAELMGGQIELLSKPGHGSTFTVILPSIGRK